MPSQLFTPFQLRDLTLQNRIVVAPMCQYSAAEGSASDWHMLHLGSLAMGGAGLLMIEATAVEARGRISHGCLGLYSDANEAALGRVVAACRRYGATPLGIQLAHAGRKASVRAPWNGHGPLGADEKPWPTVGPSAVPFDAPWHTPSALDEAGLAAIKEAFVAATRRALRIGLDLVELHSAHGYLLSAFLSPLANRRQDFYGGTPERRLRFPLEVAAAVRAAWPAEKPLGVRINGTDWAEGGITIEDAVRYAAALKEAGCDYVCVSSGGNAARPSIPIGPGYMVGLAARIRREALIPTRAVGLIVEPRQAEAIVAKGEADMVALARGFIDDPHWAWHAADALGAAVACPPQYRRGRPDLWPGAAYLKADAKVA